MDVSALGRWLLMASAPRSLDGHNVYMSCLLPLLSGDSSECRFIMWIIWQKVHAQVGLATPLGRFDMLQTISPGRGTRLRPLPVRIGQVPLAGDGFILASKIMKYGMEVDLPRLGMRFCSGQLLNTLSKMEDAELKKLQSSDMHTLPVFFLNLG